jgi:hypothetical protein
MIFNAFDKINRALLDAVKYLQVLHEFGELYHKLKLKRMRRQLMPKALYRVSCQRKYKYLRPSMRRSRPYTITKRLSV